MRNPDTDTGPDIILDPADLLDYVPPYIPKESWAPPRVCDPGFFPGVVATIQRHLVTVLPSEDGIMQAACQEMDGSISIWTWANTKWELQSTILGVPLTGPLSEHVK